MLYKKNVQLYQFWDSQNVLIELHPSQIYETKVGRRQICQHNKGQIIMLA